MNKTTVRIEGTMTTKPNKQEINVVKEKMSVPVNIDGNKYNIKTTISRNRYETYKSLVKANGNTVSAMTAELINKYIEEHVDEIIMLKDLRERL
mgnify:CR=1 FL=1